LTSQARPPLVLTVEKNKTYDIFVGRGSFSSCPNCGFDYLNSFAFLYPNISSENQFGGGLIPWGEGADPKQSPYRKDDFLYGRACFVPATMIPWTHSANTDLNTQRQTRLQRQYDLYAAGYQRDWYGFDYGSVIGSFDGSAWFSVGSKRRIKATGSRLFLAINAPLSDLTQEGSFPVELIEVTSSTPNNNIPEKDFSSDGAQCQNYHVCATDQDCVTQLGWEYTCASIGNLETPWPEFSSSGLELTNVTRTLRLKDLTNSFQGSLRRCVYRGQGAPCATDFNNTMVTNRYNGTTEKRTYACAPAYHCANITTLTSKLIREKQTLSERNLDLQMGITANCRRHPPP